MPQLTALATSTSTWPKRMSTEFYSYFLDGSGKCIERWSPSGTLHLSNAAARLLLDLHLRWEQEAHSRTETFTPVLGLALPALLYGELHLRPVHQTFLQVLSERMTHFNKGFVEVGKSMCSGFRRRCCCYQTNCLLMDYYEFHFFSRLVRAPCRSRSQRLVRRKCPRLRAGQRGTIPDRRAYQTTRSI